MAHFLAVLDREPARRDATIEGARRQLSSLRGLTQGLKSMGDLTVLWAAGPRAPVSTAGADRELALVLGEPIPGPGAARADASRVLKDWLAGPPGEVPPAYSGFYAAIVLGPAGELLVAVDLLGLFPVYYWRGNDVVLVSSSPELFRHHPAFQTRISVNGLAGILLTNGLLAGNCLLEGVRRLAPGHLLRARTDAEPEELLQFELKRSDRFFDLSMTELVDLLEETMVAAIGRCAPAGEPIGLMLSGGLDSRMLAGFLHRAAIPTVAQTRGVPGEIELRCASGVARTLGFRHLVGDEDSGDPVESVTDRVRWEHLASGLFSASGRSYTVESALPPRTMSGYLVDVVIDSSSPVSPRPEDPWDTLFDIWFGRLSRWGLPAASVGALVGDPEAPGRCIEGLRSEYKAAADSPTWARRAITMRTAGRFRVGTMPWRQSFGTWPALPSLDRELIEVANGMPMAAIGERLIEQELVCRKFPELAALPLDHNAFEDTPLRPRLRYLLTQFLLRRVGLSREGRRGKLPRGGERRYYYRTSDFNGPGWRRVRAAAEPFRRGLDRLMPDAMVDSLVPPPDATLVPEHAMGGTSGAKLLIGLMFWAQEHL